MPLIASFTVLGAAVPQGSTRTWNKYDPVTRTYKPAVTHNKRESLMLWRGAIRSAIQQQVQPSALTRDAVAVRAIFSVTKPPSIPKKRIFPIVAPDLDKLQRALGDAMEKVLLVNDAQIVAWDVWKV